MKSLLDEVKEWLNELGEARDGIIVLAGALYILGYIVWSIHAYQQHLGLLPALEAQYFVAGIVPFVILVLIVFICRGSWIRKLHLPAWLNILGNRAWLRNLLVVAVFVSAVMDRFGALDYFENYGRYLAIRNKWVFVSVVSLIVLLSLPTVDLNSDLKLKGRPKVLSLSPLVVILILVFGLYASYFWIVFLYSKLPQSLGGDQPRCAKLDLQKSGLSAETLTSLLQPNSSAENKSNPSVAGTSSGTQDGANEQVVHSEQVEILFSGNDYFLIRARGRVYDIKKDLIRSIESSPCKQGLQTIEAR